MASHAALFFAQRWRLHLRNGGDRFGQRGRSWDQLPGAFAQEQTFDRAVLSGSGDQAALQLTELAFATVVGARKTGHVIGVEQARRISLGDFGDLGAQDPQARGGLALPVEVGQTDLPFSPHLRAGARRCL